MTSSGIVLIGHLVAGDRGPADRQNHGLFLRQPGVIDALAPDDVIALLGKENTAAGQFHSEAPADEDQQGGALFASHPLSPLIALRVNAPLDLAWIGRTARRHSNYRHFRNRL